MQGVLAFDPGLRHLAVAYVTPSAAVRPPELLVRAHPTETTEEYQHRCLQWFLRHGWVVNKWEVLDVTEALDREGGVANVKSIKDWTKAAALVDTLQALKQRWFDVNDVNDVNDVSSNDHHSDRVPLPAKVVVEAQHNANAVMRGVAMVIAAYFYMTVPGVHLSYASGSRKLDICTALGVLRGDGLKDRDNQAAAKISAKAAKQAAKEAAKAAKQAAKEAAKAAKEAAKEAAKKTILAAKAAKGAKGAKGAEATSAKPTKLSTAGAMPLLDAWLTTAAADTLPAAATAATAAIDVSDQDDACVEPWQCATAAVPRVTHDVDDDVTDNDVVDDDALRKRERLNGGRGGRGGRGWRGGRGGRGGRGRGGLMHMGVKATDDYDDNKRRSVLAMQVLMPRGHETLTRYRAKGVKEDDLCDVLLMAIWTLWKSMGWRLPPRGRAPTVRAALKTAAAATAAAATTAAAAPSPRVAKVLRALAAAKAPKVPKTPKAPKVPKTALKTPTAAQKLLATLAQASGPSDTSADASDTSSDDASDASES